MFTHFFKNILFLFRIFFVSYMGCKNLVVGTHCTEDLDELQLMVLT